MTITSVSIRSRFPYVLTLLTFVIGAVGCAPAPAPASPPPPPPIATNTALPTVAPTDTPVPLPSPTIFVPKATIKVVVHVPLSGDFANYGIDMERAAEMAVKQMVGPLNALGYQIELATYDDEGNVTTAVANARQFAADAEVLCGVGNMNSAVTLPLSEVYHKAGLPFVSPSSTTPAVTDRGYLEMNRVAGRDDAQGMAGARFAIAQGFKRAFVVSDGSEYGRRNGEYFRRELYGSGTKVVGSVVTNRTSQFDSIVAEVIAAGSDFVYLAGYMKAGAEFIREARAADYTGAFLGPESFGVPALVEVAGPLLIDGGGTYYTTTAAQASAYPDAVQFAQDFQMLYDKSPVTYAAQAYDAAGVCLAAIREASQAKNGELPTRKEVATAIRSLKDHKGITGTYNFNNKGDPTLTTYFVYKVAGIDPNQWDQNSLVASYRVPPPK